MPWPSASRGTGRSGHVPSVGCVIVSPDGRIVGRGRTSEQGRPHAEAVALAHSGAAARGATAYVSLEPCSHASNSGPPCADALIQAGIARVVVAVSDPDPRVNGSGIARLRDAGIAVTLDVLKDEATALAKGFFLRLTENRPLVTLKIAQSADGRTATASDRSPWITGAEARKFGQLLRAKHDAILVGIETALADDPELTCRIPGLEKYSPVRIVLDSKLRLDPESKLAQTAKQVSTLVFTTAEGSETLQALGVEIVRVEGSGRVSIPSVLHILAKRGINRLLVEGGITVIESFLNEGFTDRLEIFTAPVTLGKAGRGEVKAEALRKPGEAPNFVRVSTRSFGEDRLESFAARA